MQTISPEFVILAILGISYFYIFIYQYFAHKKCNYVHETAVVMILGILIGIPIFILDPDILQGQKLSNLCRSVIILVLIPPMLFEDGYNIPKRKFFQNIFYINLFGIFGTIINFTVIFFIIYFFNENNLISLVWQDRIINLSNFQMILFAAVMCSIDTVVPQSIVNPERYPKLFSIIFGQSIMKDTITFTLVSALMLLQNNKGNANDLYIEDLGVTLLYFLAVVIGSICIGIASALFTTILFKNFRFLIYEKGIAEIGLIMMTGYAAYIIGETSKCSGVIAMLFCGIFLSHFNIYNLTPEGKTSTKLAVTTLALITQGLLFCLLGAYILNIQASSITNNDSGQNVQYYSFSWNFILIGFLCLFVGRFFNVYVLSFFGKFLVGKQKWRLNRHQYLILYVSGLARGAIPFALILTTPMNGGNSQIAGQSMINTVTIIVFITSLFFNSLMPKIIRNQLKNIKKLMIKNPKHPSVFDSMLVAYQQSNQEKQVSINVENQQNFSEKTNRFEQLTVYTKIKGSTQKYFRKCQEGFLKPLLIYDYYSRKDAIKEEKKRLRKKQCEQYWQRFHSQGSMTQHEKQYNIMIDQFIIDNDESKSEVVHKIASLKEPENQQKIIQLRQKQYFSERGYSIKKRDLGRQKSCQKASLKSR